MNEQKIIFVSGKGGVGKSTVAASVALNLSLQKKKVLLVELGTESFYADYLNIEFQDEFIKFNDFMDIARWGGVESLKRYIAHYVKIDKIVDLFIENKVMRTLINTAPGLKELSLLGRITSGARHFGPPLKYDYIVVDSYATGHLLALLRAPIGMYEVIRYGPMGQQCSQIIDVIKNKNICEFYLVTLLEELPIEETRELSEILKNEFNASIKLIANKSMDEIHFTQNFDAKELTEFKNEYEKKYNLQKKILLDLKKQDPQLCELPFIFENEGRKLINTLSKVLRSKCENL